MRGDPLEVLANYVPIFDEALIDISGSEAGVTEVLAAWRIYVEHGEPDENGA